jgi:polar amino acid transport system substrate-binding protein
MQVLPWVRCWEYVKSGQVDVGLGISRTRNPVNREDYVFYPQNAVWDAEYVFFTHVDILRQVQISSYADAVNSKLPIGVINGNSYHESFWNAFPWQDSARTAYNAQLFPANDAETNFRKLNAGRISLYPMDRTVGVYTAAMLKLDKVTHYPFVLFSKPYYNVFSKKSEFHSEKYADIYTLMQAYDAELARFKKTPAFAEIMARPR